MSDDLGKREFMIFKAGRGWYRSESQGYTSFKFDAGRYTREEAVSITHPNGEDGPRDGMFFKHESEVRDYVSDRIEALESELAAVPALVMREAMDWVRDHDAELAEKMEAKAKTPDALTAEVALKAHEKQVKEQQQAALLGKLEAMLQDTDTAEAETTNATLCAVMDLVRDMEMADE